MPTGWALLAILSLIGVCSIAIVRRKRFQLFYWVHWLHVPFYILLIIHAKNFWKWFVGSFFLMVLERILRLYRMLSRKYGRTFIKNIYLLDSSVLKLVIPRPKNFKYYSGDYIFVNIPNVSYYEYHPFTVSSSPEQLDYLTLHIKVAGDWTKKLLDFYMRKQAPFRYNSLPDISSDQVSKFHKENPDMSANYKIIFVNEVTNTQDQEVKEEKSL